MTSRPCSQQVLDKLQIITRHECQCVIVKLNKIAMDEEAEPAAIHRKWVKKSFAWNISCFYVISSIPTIDLNHCLLLRVCFQVFLRWKRVFMQKYTSQYQVLNHTSNLNFIYIWQKGTPSHQPPSPGFTCTI